MVILGSQESGTIEEYGTATVDDVLQGKTVLKESGIETGTMPNNGAIDEEITEEGGYCTIPLGYHNGTGKVTATYVSTGEYGDAAVGDVLVGKTIGTDTGIKTGTMPNNGSISETITTQNGTKTIAAGYHNGSGTVKATFANLVAGNIKNGVTIGGVVGSLAVGSPYAEGYETSTSVTQKIYISGIGFAPKIIIFYEYDDGFKGNIVVYIKDIVDSGTIVWKADGFEAGNLKPSQVYRWHAIKG